MAKTQTQSFQVHATVLEVRIAATRQRVWRALVEETSSCGTATFYTGAKPRGFHLEPRLAGACGRTGATARVSCGGP
jgi:hypothetical protein